MKPSRALPLVNVIGFLGMMAANMLANILPYNNLTTGQVSARFPNLFTPAGFTFGIWGVIYTLLLAFAVYQAWPRPSSGPGPAWHAKISWFFALSCLANAGWLLAFHYLQIELSMVLIVALLATLIAIYLRLDVGRAVVAAPTRWMVHLPFSVYLGWVAVATIANATILLGHWGWQGQPGGPQLWTLVVMATAAGLALRALWARRDVALAAVIAWGLIGVYAQRRGDTRLTDDRLVELGAMACIALIAVGIASTLVKRRPTSALV